MTLTASKFLASASLSLLLVGCNAAPTRVSDAAYERQTLTYLASDSLEGRGVGTAGLDRAGDFIAEQFRKDGLQPIPGQGFFYPFPYSSGMKIDPATTLTLGGKALALDTDYRPNSMTTRDKAFDGDVVYAGYGITSTQYKYDDYTGLDAKGKVVLIERFEPRDEKNESRFTHSPEWSAEASLARKIMTAQGKGAKAVVLVNPPGEKEDALSPFAGRGARGGVMIPVVQISRQALDAALQSSGNPTIESLSAPIDSTGTPAPKPLSGLAAAGEVKLSTNTMWVKDVVGMIPGSGPHANEYVVVGAHYDHLGHGGAGSLAGSVNAIHHGADDNASGTTTMLTLARRFGEMAKEKGPPARSLIFMAFTAEEEGLIGSQKWVNEPTVPIKDVAYMLNLDMVGRVKNGVVQHGGSGTAQVFDDILKQAFDGSGLTPKSMGAGGNGPSDHASFSAKKVPVLFLFTGLHADYHRPTDTSDKINYDGMLKVTDVADKIVAAMLTAPRQKYNDEADKSPVNVNFQDAFPSTTRPAPMAPPAERVGLGIMPDMSLQDRGMRVEGVTANSAAGRAGLKGGDVIVELDGNRIDSVEDLQAIYDHHKPGDKVTVKYLRAGKPMSAEVTFSRRAPQN